MPGRSQVEVHATCEHCGAHDVFDSTEARAREIMAQLDAGSTSYRCAACQYIDVTEDADNVEIEEAYDWCFISQ